MKSQGFSILELLLTLGVVVLLGAIAFPCYKDYMKRVYYKSIVQVAEPFKVGITKCYEKLGNLKGCNGGKNQVPADTTVAKGPIISAHVVNGVITVIPAAANGITTNDIYILTPTVTDKKELSWKDSGVGAERYTD